MSYAGLDTPLSMRSMDRRTKEEKAPMDSAQQQWWIPFCGRPNAGKSSLITALSGKKLRTGRSPGTTRKIAVIPVFRDISFLDLPGFGRVSRRSKRFAEDLKTNLIRELEAKSSYFLCSVLVVDLKTFPKAYESLERKGIIPLDIEFASFLLELTSNHESQGTVIVAANKIDRLNSTTLTKNLAILTNKLPPGVEIIPISCKTKIGIRKIRNKLKNVVIRKMGTQYQQFLSH
jgi:GTP-binding protein EngB required for normal cell division